MTQYFCYYSHFYRELIRGSGASPTEAVVRTWLKAIHEKMGADSVHRGHSFCTGESCRFCEIQEEIIK